jgi:hypothetical protein
MSSLPLLAAEQPLHDVFEHLVGASVELFASYAANRVEDGDDACVTQSALLRRLQREIRELVRRYHDGG